ncbi:endonuclease/exonuclease/phosphatase family protein [Chryseobacterium arachidis]|uniref:endonuclease/exonuclease/phosphatase family protein n=1 Tax=Chryseobacterium arachidis TaxID=1416778 RepID=UPI00361D8EC0
MGLLFFNPVLRWINFSGKSSSEIEDADLKIISLNAKNATFGLKNIEAYIDRQQADIVLLQEYGYGTDYHFNGLKEGEKNAGVAFFTRHKIISQKKIIEGSYEHNNAYVTQTDIEIKGKIYRIINMYLQPFQFEKSMIQLDGNIDKREEKLKNIVKRLIPTFKMHQEQIIPIRESIETSPYPVILAGDFNAVPNSYEYYQLADGLQDAFVKAGNGSSTSFHEYKFPIRIDYVFCSESIQPLSYKVDRSVRLSDHYPVITTFKLDN